MSSRSTLIEQELSERNFQGAPRNDVKLFGRAERPRKQYGSGGGSKAIITVEGLKESTAEKKGNNCVQWNGPYDYKYQVGIGDRGECINLNF